MLIKNTQLMFEKLPTELIELVYSELYNKEELSSLINLSRTSKRMKTIFESWLKRRYVLRTEMHLEEFINQENINPKTINPVYINGNIIYYEVYSINPIVEETSLFLDYLDCMINFQLISSNIASRNILTKKN